MNRVGLQHRGATRAASSDLLGVAGSVAKQVEMRAEKSDAFVATVNAI